MNKINEVKNVLGVVFGSRERLIIGNGKYISSSDLNSYKLEGAYGSRPLVVLNNYVLLQEENFAKIFVLDFQGALIHEIEEGFNLYQVIRTPDNGILIPCNRTKSYWIFDENLNKKDLGKYFRISITLENLALDYSNTEVVARPFFEEEILWKEDVSTFCRNIRKHRETGEVLSDGPNEIDGELFSYEGLLYVPLKGGQLLALNASDGKKVWIWEHDRIGAYGIVGDKIYKQDGKEVYEIDALTGSLLKTKKLSDAPSLQGFHASGPIWVYQDILVVADVLSGKICILDRLSFEILDFFTINKKLPFNNNTIIWHENRLYVLDLENTLHILSQIK